VMLDVEKSMFSSSRRCDVRREEIDVFQLTDAAPGTTTE